MLGTQSGLKSLPINISYKNFYIYSSVSPHSWESFSLFLPCVNTEIMKTYLEQLSMAYPDKELRLIVDPSRLAFFKRPASSRKHTDWVFAPLLTGVQSCRKTIAVATQPRLPQSPFQNGKTIGGGLDQCNQFTILFRVRNLMPPLIFVAFYLKICISQYMLWLLHLLHKLSRR